MPTRATGQFALDARLSERLRAKRDRSSAYQAYLDRLRAGTERGRTPG